MYVTIPPPVASPFRTKLTMFLVDLHSNGHGRVHGVRDDGETSIGAVACTRIGKVHCDLCVRVEQIVTGHAGFSGHTGGYDDERTSFHAVVQLLRSCVCTGIESCCNTTKASIRKVSYYLKSLIDFSIRSCEDTACKAFLVVLQQNCSVCE